MEELVQVISAKAGISEDQARLAVQAFVAFLKEKFPTALAEHLDRALSPEAPSPGGSTSGSPPAPAGVPQRSSRVRRMPATGSRVNPPFGTFVTVTGNSNPSGWRVAPKTKGRTK